MENSWSKSCTKLNPYSSSFLRKFSSTSSPHSLLVSHGCDNIILISTGPPGKLRVGALFVIPLCYNLPMPQQRSPSPHQFHNPQICPPFPLNTEMGEVFSGDQALSLPPHRPTLRLYHRPASRSFPTHQWVVQPVSSCERGSGKIHQ